MIKPYKPTFSCPEHLPRPPRMPPFDLRNPLTTNTSNMSSQRTMAGEYSDMSSTKEPLILVVRYRIFQNRSTIWESYLQNTLPILSTVQPSSIRILYYIYRMSHQTYYLNKFLPNSWPAKDFPLLLAPSTPIFFIFNVNVVVQLSMTKTTFAPYTITLKPPLPLWHPTDVTE